VELRRKRTGVALGDENRIGEAKGRKAEKSGDDQKDLPKGERVDAD
jgi:hypothetical protein